MNPPAVLDSHRKKIATMCEPYGILTAWHGPGNIAPIAHMANAHVSLSVPNFGIQEYATSWTDAVREVVDALPAYAGVRAPPATHHSPAGRHALAVLGGGSIHPHPLGADGPCTPPRPTPIRVCANPILEAIVVY